MMKTWQRNLIALILIDFNWYKDSCNTNFSYFFQINKGAEIPSIFN